MAIKANASSQGGSGDFKRFIGVGSFRVMGVNPTKEEMEKFFGREIGKEPEYLKDKVDERDNNKPYKQLRVTFLLQADLKYEDGKVIESNKALKEPLKTSVSFFIDSRYLFNSDKTKVQVIDKYGRTAWVTIEQAKNHQIPVYKNGPAKLDADYRPAYRGEDELTQFIINYLNVAQIDIYNRNTGVWSINPNPEDCEANLYKIQNYFKGDISELKEYSTMMPCNRVKLCMGVQTDSEGHQFNVVYSGLSLRNGSKSYTIFKDKFEGSQSSTVRSTVFSDDHAGIISDLHEYKEDVQETNFSEEESDPFKQAMALPEDELPFPDSAPTSENPFEGM